jgi:hypothetical protein
MGAPEDIPSLEVFPLSPRVRREVMESHFAPAVASRSLTPMRSPEVEFKHTDDPAVGEESLYKHKRGFRHTITSYTRSADRLGIFLLAGALVILVVVAVFLQLKAKKATQASGSSESQTTITPEVDFYSGGDVFSKKLQEEREAKSGVSRPQLASPLDKELEVSLKEQMESMNARLESMRSQKLLEESPISSPNPRPVPVTSQPVKPADERNFSSPLELNGILPKQLRGEPRK